MMQEQSWGNQSVLNSTSKRPREPEVDYPSEFAWHQPGAGKRQKADLKSEGFSKFGTVRGFHQSSSRKRQLPWDQINSGTFDAKKQKIEEDHLSSSLAMVPFHRPYGPFEKPKMKQFAICDRVLPKLIQDNEPGVLQYSEPGSLAMVPYDPRQQPQQTVNVPKQPGMYGNQGCEIKEVDDEEDVMMEL